MWNMKYSYTLMGLVY